MAESRLALVRPSKASSSPALVRLCQHCIVLAKPWAVMCSKGVVLRRAALFRYCKALSSTGAAMRGDVMVRYSPVVSGYA